MSSTPSQLDKDTGLSKFVENANEIETIEDTGVPPIKPSGFGGHLIVSDI